MQTFTNSLIILLICLPTAFILFHLINNKASLGIKGLMGFLAIFSIFVFTNYGNFHTVKKDTPEFIKATGSQVKSSYFHWHEIYHYYLGSKYYKELGHYGLYEAVALADKESGNPQLDLPFIRSLASPMENISFDEALRRGREIYKPRFTTERWQEFSKDLAYMKSIAMDKWLNLGMFDVGYNPPPTWAVIGSTMSNIVPLSESWFDYGPTWDQAEFLPLFDVLLMAIACFFLWRSFGFITMCLFIIGFCTSFVSGPNWVAGSFFRHIWLFSLIMGTCMFKQNRYYTAGIFWGLSGCMRIFPFIFVVGAGLAMLIKWYGGNKEYRNRFFSFGYGVATTLAILVPISFAMFGLDSWIEFTENIMVHNNLNFVGHLGYKKVVTFGDWTPGQNFWWYDGLDRFVDWNNRMNTEWNNVFPYQFPFIAIILGAAISVMNRISIVESSFLFGGLVIFFFEVPANYYYSYLAIVPVIGYGFARKGNWKDYGLAIAFFIMWAAIYYVPNFTRDGIIHAYYFSTIILSFFLFWTFMRVVNIEDLYALIKYNPKKLSSGKKNG